MRLPVPSGNVASTPAARLVQVPLLTADAIASGRIAPNSLVRYVGMVQSMYEPEVYGPMRTETDRTGEWSGEATQPLRRIAALVCQLAYHTGAFVAPWPRVRAGKRVVAPSAFREAAGAVRDSTDFSGRAMR